MGFSFRAPRDFLVVGLGELGRSSGLVGLGEVWWSLVGSDGGSGGVWRDLMGTGWALVGSGRFWFDLVESRAGP